MKLPREELLERLSREGVPRETAEEFLRYHHENREIWDEFKTACEKLVAAGRKHYGAMAILNHLRFERAVRGKDEFKINNNFAPYYARLWRIRYPEHAELFETRQIISGLTDALEVSRF